jgi:hypothetical protein
MLLRHQANQGVSRDRRGPHRLHDLKTVAEIGTPA